MRFSVLCALLVFAPLLSVAESRQQGQLVFDGMPELDPQIADSLSRYSHIRHASLVDWMPDGQSLIIRTRFAESNQLHQVHKPLGARTQLTFFSEPIASTVIRPDKAVQQMVYLRDTGGSENYQLYLFDLASGSHQLLSDGKSRYQSPHFSASGQFLFYASNERNGVDFDLYQRNMASGEVRRIYEVIGSYHVVDVSRDEKQVLARQYISVSESRLVLIDLENLKVQAVRPLPGRVAYDDAAFSPDGQQLYLSYSGSNEFKQLARYDMSHQSLSAPLVNHDWDIERFSLSDDGRFLAYVVNEDGSDTLTVLDLQSNQVLSLPPLPMVAINAMSFSPDASRLAISYSSVVSPSDVFVVSLNEPRWQQWTASELGGLDSKRFVTPELVRYPTFDQVKGQPRQIPAWVYTPKNLIGKAPVVISIHGGPEGQSRADFAAMTQYLVSERGIAVIEPNVRGSAGYGQSYLALDNGFGREDSVKDIGALLDWIQTQPDLDAGRVVVWGGSYGGYMVLASLVHYSERLRGGIDVVGISHFSTFLKNTKGYRQDLRRVEYGDERDPEMRAFHEKIAPLNNAGQIKVPLFVVQGLNDPRVPASEAEQIVKRVRENGMPVWYLLAKDEGHGFAKKSNRDVYQTMAVQFLQQQLLETMQ